MKTHRALCAMRLSLVVCGACLAVVVNLGALGIKPYSPAEWTIVLGLPSLALIILALGMEGSDGE